MTSEPYITYAKSLTAALGIVVLVIGWLFTLLVDEQRGNTAIVKILSERIAVLEVKVQIHQEQIHGMNNEKLSQ